VRPSPAETDYEPRAAVRDQPHFARLARLEAHSHSRRDVQARAERRVPIEGQRRIRLGEMKVTAHLNRTVTGFATVSAMVARS
jgi:hypothetical protein